MSERYFLDAGEPLAEALEEARAVARQADASATVGAAASLVEQVDAAYGRVLELVPADDAGLWALLAAEHVGVVRAIGALTTAAYRCDRYLPQVRALTHRLPLLIERAQVRSESGRHASAATDAAEIRKALDDDPGAELDLADHARLRRVEGLAAAAVGDRVTADRFLIEARGAFQSIGDSDAVAVIDRDLRLIRARGGSDQATSEILAEDAEAEPMSAPRALAHALALKNQHRYEEALQVVVALLAADHLDDALRLPVLEELVGLLVALRRGKALKALSAELPQTLQTLVRAGGSVEGTEPPAVRFIRVLLNCFRLLDAGQAERARTELNAVRALAVSDRDRAHWHVASGEVSIAVFKRRKAGSDLDEAVWDLGAACEYAVADQLLEVRIRALRLLGEAFELRKEPDQASDRWARAHALEEDLVARQVSDEVRATLLEDIPTEHDERVRVAAELAVAGPGDAAAVTGVASAIVAMESARGAAILGRIAPDAESALRRLPPAGDGAAAWEWLRGIAAATARDEAIWIMHARPDRVHHGIVGRGLVHHVDLPADRGELEKLVKALRKECNEYRLAQAAGRAQVSQLIERLGAAIGVETVLGLVPRRVKRLVVIAGGVLSEIPLAALPIKADSISVPIVSRFAVSDLPCLSARPLLRQRSVGNRGGRALLVNAFEATPEDFERELRRVHYRRVRILGHGQSDAKDASQTWLQFAGKKNDRDGRIHPGRFQQADLRSCGTLMLGACESGMAQRVGRDERTGFVRAGLHAGAASVVAARWIAEVSVTTALLDRFEDYLRYLPRDVALQRAQLDVRAGRVAPAAEVPEPEHPAWWACWTLYGDSGHQVRAPILRASACRPALLFRRLFRTP
ncbi:CHAT domain-containing protein [Catenulispora rubra]|uniref:CHAT domain-containing protein n=1 Tax=Catenulispora rubra TaxID=280293 RepID=UPI00189240FB|nr:CHAT domain-containing protein [Catenulispora rubra]